MKELSDWDSFYVILGSAAAALIGLQFVVMTLIAERPPKGAAQAGGTFGTPTIIHFCAALLLSLLARAPWPGTGPLALFWGVTGLCGVIYMAITWRRIKAQSSYLPDLEDWIFHAYLPLLGYAAIAVSGLALETRPVAALFGAGAAALLLLYIGIHNAWDSVIFISIQPAQDDDKKNVKP